MSAADSVQASLRRCLAPGQGRRARPLLVAGSCAMESRQQVLSTAMTLQTAAAESGFDFIFKASFDKANRNSLSSWRGPGIEAGLELLGELRGELELPILCDIHEPSQAEQAALFGDRLCGEVMEAVLAPIGGDWNVFHAAWAGL